MKNNIPLISLLLLIVVSLACGKSSPLEPAQPLPAAKNTSAAINTPVPDAPPTSTPQPTEIPTATQPAYSEPVLLAEIKKSQDAVEKSTRDSLRDQIGIRKAASTGIGSNIDEMRTRLAEMAKKADGQASESVPQATIVPALLVPPAFTNSELIRFVSKIECSLARQAIHVGDGLAAKKNGDRYDIGKPNAPFAFANVSEQDFNTLRNGLPLIPEPALVKGNGHSKLELDPT